MLKEVANAQFHFIPQLGKSKDKADLDLMLKEDQVLQRLFFSRGVQEHSPPKTPCLCAHVLEYRKQAALMLVPLIHTTSIFLENQSTTKEVEA